jgi:hypothetical protein
MIHAGDRKKKLSALGAAVANGDLRGLWRSSRGGADDVVSHEVYVSGWMGRRLCIR